MGFLSWFLSKYTCSFNCLVFLLTVTGFLVKVGLSWVFNFISVNFLLNSNFLVISTVFLTTIVSTVKQLSIVSGLSLGGFLGGLLSVFLSV